MAWCHLATSHYLRNNWGITFPRFIVAHNMCSQTRTNISNYPWNDDLVQDCSMSSVLAMELLQTCTKPLIYTFGYCCNMVRYSYVLLTSALQKLRTLVTGKIHPISCPHGPAMGFLLWGFWRKNWPVITAPHRNKYEINMWTLQTQIQSITCFLMAQWCQELQGPSLQVSTGDIMRFDTEYISHSWHVSWWLGDNSRTGAKALALLHRLLSPQHSYLPSWQMLEIFLYWVCRKHQDEG